MSKITVDQIETTGGSKLIINDGISFNIPVRIKNYTTAQVNALTGMEIGDLVYDTDVELLKIYSGTDWLEVAGAPNEFDVINESTLGTGVTTDGVLHKDGEVYTDRIYEQNAGAGVNIDGTLIKDIGIETDTIVEATANQGVTIEGSVLKDGGITVAGDILPNTDSTHDLGSTDYKFQDLHLAGSTIYLGARTITADSNDLKVDGGIKADSISEFTAAGGITIPSDITFTGELDMTGATGVGFPTGKVGNWEYSFSDTEQTFAVPYDDTGIEITPLTTTIFPTQGNSKIMIILTLYGEAAAHDMMGYFSRTVSGSAEVKLRPTAVTGQRGAFMVGNYPDGDYSSTPYQTNYTYIDSPATTNSTVYKLYLAKSGSGTTNFRFNGTINTSTSLNYEKGHSTVTLLELLAWTV